MNHMHPPDNSNFLFLVLRTSIFSFFGTLIVSIHSRQFYTHKESNGINDHFKHLNCLYLQGSELIRNLSLEGTNGIYKERNDQTGSILYKAEADPPQKNKIYLIWTSKANWCVLLQYSTVESSSIFNNHIFRNALRS